MSKWLRPRAGHVYRLKFGRLMVKMVMIRLDEQHGGGVTVEVHSAHQSSIARSVAPLMISRRLGVVTLIVDATRVTSGAESWE